MARIDDKKFAGLPSLADAVCGHRLARSAAGSASDIEHQTAVRDPEGVSCTCEYFNSAVAMATCLTSQPLLQRAPSGRTYSYMRTYIFVYRVSSRLSLMYFSVFSLRCTSGSASAPPSSCFLLHPLHFSQSVSNRSGTGAFIFMRTEKTHTHTVDRR